VSSAAAVSLEDYRTGTFRAGRYRAVFAAGFWEIQYKPGWFFWKEIDFRFRRADAVTDVMWRNNHNGRRAPIENHVQCTIERPCAACARFY
jgi:hypothetical protein